MALMPRLSHFKKNLGLKSGGGDANKKGTIRLTLSFPLFFLSACSWVFGLRVWISENRLCYRCAFWKADRRLHYS